MSSWKKGSYWTSLPKRKTSKTEEPVYRCIFRGAGRARNVRHFDKLVPKPVQLSVIASLVEVTPEQDLH